jgi:hypothetical protein
MSKDIDWAEYERRKAEIQEQGLTCEEYEKAIDQIVDELSLETEEEAA